MTHIFDIFLWLVLSNILAISKTVTNIGLKEVRTHALRKNFEYHHYKQFKDITILQQIFNHSFPSVTLRYLGINQDEIDKSYSNFCL